MYVLIIVKCTEFLLEMGLYCIIYYIIFIAFNLQTMINVKIKVWKKHKYLISEALRACLEYLKTG